MLTGVTTVDYHWVLGRDEKVTFLQRQQFDYPFSKSTKVLSVQVVWHSQKHVTHFGERSGFPYYNMTTPPPSSPPPPPMEEGSVFLPFRDTLGSSEGGGCVWWIFMDTQWNKYNLDFYFPYCSYAHVICIYYNTKTSTKVVHLTWKDWLVDGKIKLCELDLLLRYTILPEDRLVKDKAGVFTENTTRWKVTCNIMTRTRVS